MLFYCLVFMSVILFGGGELRVEFSISVLNKTTHRRCIYRFPHIDIVKISKLYWKPVKGSKSSVICKSWLVFVSSLSAVFWTN